MVNLVPLAAALALLPGFSPYARYGQPPAGGMLLRGTFPDLQAPAPLRPGYVYLPPRFSAANRYPVVYLLHGLPGTPTQYINSLSLAQWADPRIADGELRPFIAVIPAAGTRLPPRYNGEWAGPWERYLVRGVIPWVDSHLPTIASAKGRMLAGLSAGGYGAMDIGLRHPELFGALASWSGYFHPLRDGPFAHVDSRTLNANDPRLLVRVGAARLRRDGTRFFVSTGPPHSHQASPEESVAFAGELRQLDLPVQFRTFAETHWRSEFEAGLTWAFGR